MESGFFDLSKITTVEGDRTCAFSPPAGWEGCAIDYVEMIRVRYQADLEFRVNLDAYARYFQRFSERVEITGPFVEQVESILHRLAYRQYQDQPGQAAR